MFSKGLAVISNRQEMEPEVAKSVSPWVGLTTVQGSRHREFAVGGTRQGPCQPGERRTLLSSLPSKQSHSLVKTQGLQPRKLMITNSQTLG